MDYPKLIENSAKFHLYNTLQKCHENRVSVYYYVLNIGVFCVFILVTGLILYFCSKNKLTEYEKNQKILRDQQYVLSKIRFFQEDSKTKKDSDFSSITGLPYIDMSRDMENSK